MVTYGHYWGWYGCCAPRNSHANSLHPLQCKQHSCHLSSPHWQQRLCQHEVAHFWHRLAHMWLAQYHQATWHGSCAGRWDFWSSWVHKKASWHDLCIVCFFLRAFLLCVISMG